MVPGRGLLEANVASMSSNKVKFPAFVAGRGKVVTIGVGGAWLIGRLDLLEDMDVRRLNILLLLRRRPPVK